MKKRMLYLILGISLIINMIHCNISYGGEYKEDFLLETYPSNNQEDVERNPLIKFKFKYNTELIDESKITISSDGNIYAADFNQDTWITYDGSTLNIDINSIESVGKSALRANTIYKVKIGEGALKLKNKNKDGTIDEILNKEISLYFITGKNFIQKDNVLRVEKYTSSDEISFDDITNSNNTKLGKDGSVYIHFNREIKWNQWTANPKVKNNKEALKYFKIYKVPEAYKKNKDSNGILYDSEFRYGEKRLNISTNKVEEVDIESVEIVKDGKGKKRVIKITPKKDLILFNKYNIKLSNKDIITDNLEKTLGYNIDKIIWTKKDIDPQNPKWLIDNISLEEKIEIGEGLYKSYAIHGAPNYNEYIDEKKAKPIVLYSDKEIIVNPILSDPLNYVNLSEGYGEDDKSLSRRTIKWYQIEYFFEDGIKKTKLSLYPEKELDSGKYYELNINPGSFVSRSNKKLPTVTLKFVIEGDGAVGIDRGIYKFKIRKEMKGDIVEPIHRPFLITDFNEDDSQIKFDITGYNFAEDIKQLRFVRREINGSEGKTIKVPSADLVFHDVTKITGEIKASAKSEFTKVYSEREDGLTKTSAGVYDVYIDFNRGNSAKLTTENQRFIVKDRPKIVETTPYDKESYFEPESLYKRFDDSEQNGYYIKAVFEDIGGMLELKDKINHEIRVEVVGNSDNLVNNTKALKYEREPVKNEYKTNKFILYIPLIDKLEDGQEYVVHIPEEKIVEYKHKDKNGRVVKLNTEDETELGDNRSYRWTFNTNYSPKAERLYEGSLSEYYDDEYPIAIDGSMFNSKTKVEFRDTSDYTYRADSVRLRDNTLYIYLPRRRRLPVGLYDIVISNGYDYETEMIYGVLSIVEEGDYIPNEDYRVKNENRREIVKGNIDRSSDVLEIKSRYTDRRNMKIDLDELMGREAWVRTIEYSTGTRDSINELELKSKWANTRINNLSLSRDRKERYIELRVGRVEASVSDSLKKKLRGKNIKSNFLEVSGENFDFTSLTIEIPYIQSDGSNLKMLRYDEDMRSFEEIPFTIDLINKKLKGITTKAGIFVIVE